MVRMNMSLQWVSLCLLLAAVAGCNIVGAVQYATMGPPRQEAQYVPEKRPTVVFVENYQAPSQVALDADAFTALMARELMANGVVPVVGQEELFELRERKGPEAFAKMRISEVGRAVGAEQVLYIELLSSRVEEAAGGLTKARMAARLKLVDVETGRTLWPEDMSNGFPVAYETPMAKREETVSLKTVREEMLRTMARRTARLFYSWKPADAKEASEG